MTAPDAFHRDDQVDQQAPSTKFPTFENWFAN